LAGSKSAIIGAIAQYKMNSLIKKIISGARNPRSRRGFTLLEMIVSLSMIALVASLFIANYRSINKRMDLTVVAQNLAADLHLAQNNALGLVKYNGLVPPGGWGIAFNTASSSYTLFADLNAPGETGYMQYDSEDEGITGYGARVTKLPDGVEISKLEAGSLPDNPEVSVTFLPPDPATNIYSGGATTTSLLIELTEKRDNSQKTVRVNFLGLVEVLD